jgi:HSP20 family protein
MADTVQNWSPAREMDRVRQNFDDFFNRFFGTRRPIPPMSERLMWPAVECFRENDRLVLRADIPGVDPKDVKVSVHGNVLTLSGSREEKHEQKARDYIKREFSYGAFQRPLTLPPDVDTGQMTTSHSQGVIELTMPFKTAARTVTPTVEESAPTPKP